MEGIASFDVSTVLAQWESELEGLVLFGSASRGDLWETSDIDLLLVVRDGIEITRDLYRKWEAASVWNERVSPQFVALPETEETAGGVWLEAAIDGIVLWDRDLRVSRLLGQLRRAMAEGRLIRRYAHGQPYWVRTRSAA
jgi:predicted nucleotidyltransferase